MDSSAFLRQLTSHPGYMGQIAHVEHIQPREASWGKLDKPLVSSLQSCIDEYGLFPLYAHQASIENTGRPLGDRPRGPGHTRQASGNGAGRQD